MRVAAAIVGVLFPLEGLYLRRSGLPDDDTLTLLLLPLCVLAIFQFARARRGV